MSILRRREMAREYHGKAYKCEESIRMEMRALRPLGVQSEWAQVLGLAPRRGVVVDVPGIGEVVFAKARRPSEVQLAGWRVLAEDANRLRREAARLDTVAFLVREGCCIGNRYALERELELQAEGLTDAAEDLQIERERAFWARYPDAETGIVRGGEIEPRFETYRNGKLVDVREV